MNVRKIWLITVLMSTALAGIILVQAYYISNAIDLRRTIFQEQVSTALRSTVDRMDRHMAAELLQERGEWRLLRDAAFEPLDTTGLAADIADSLLRDYLSYDPGALSGGGLSPGQSSALGGTAIEMPDITLPMPGIDRSSPSGENDDPAAGVGRFMTEPFNITSSVYDVGEDEYEELLPELLANTQAQVVANVRRFNALVGDVMVELMRGKYGPTRRIDPELVDSLLELELAQRGIAVPYEFGIVLGDEQFITTVANSAQEEQLLESPHRVSLHPENLFASSDELYVLFPKEKRYVLERVWTVLTGSGLFTLIIILGFSYTISALFRQKKVADIKNDFINNMTHEFKTPIATISLAVDSMANPRISGNPERIQHYTNIIRDENRRMNSQVEKVLQMALLDRNEIKLSRENLDLHQVARTASEAMGIQVDSKGGSLTLDLKAERPMVFADEVHITNVVQNLLDNANKYSPEAPVIGIETWNDRHGVYLAVTDQGMGMSRETQNSIFEKFYRSPKGNVHDVKGFGLGLTYVKAILDAHGGSITVKSQLDKGSRFIIYLPTAS
jgi:signal transduction histidine kinase